MIYIFFDVKKKKLIKCFLIFNIVISIAVIYDIFDKMNLQNLGGR